MTPFRTKIKIFAITPLYTSIDLAIQDCHLPLSPAEHQYLVSVLTHYAFPKVSVQFAGQGAYPAGEPAWDNTRSLCSCEVPLTAAQMQVAKPRHGPKRIIKNHDCLKHFL